MTMLSTGIGSELHWIQTSAFERYFELYSKHAVIGKLRFEAHGTAHGTLTIASPATEGWKLEGTGILKPRVTIRETGSDDDLAIHRSGFWGDGWVEFVQGSNFQWKPTSFWAIERGFYNERKELLFTLEPKLYLLKIHFVVKLEARCNGLDELPLLLMLACFLRARDSFAGG